MIPLTLALVAHGADPTRRIALLVGDNDGGAGRITLRYAHRDAQAMASVLQELGGVDPRDAFVLYDPTRAELLATLDQVHLELEGADGAGEFLFYYSGHSDESGLLLGGEKMEYREIKHTLNELPARVRLAILDSCASGAMIVTKGGRQVPAFLADESIQVDGSAYITSSSADEVAQEAERIGGSYFTHFLASGLRGAADATGDGRVTLHEAYSYAYDETLAQTERTQHGPQHAMSSLRLDGTGELVLTDLALTSASLVLDESLAGQALIRDLDGNLVIELRKIAGRPVELGLAEGTYTVTLVNGDEQYGVAKVALSTGASTRLDADQLQWRDADPAVARGDLPAPPPTAVVSSESELRVLWPRFSLAPGLPAAPIGRDTLVFSGIADRSAELDGAAFSLGVYMVDGRAEGFESGLIATTAGELRGFQGSLGANVTSGGGVGGQLTVGGNVSGGPFDGVQTSGGANVVDGALRGAQLSMGANFASGSMQGSQTTLGLNWAGPGSRGAQLSFGANYAKEFDGAQIALVNVGGDVNGVQIGLVNIGRVVKGAQIGLINVARDVDGVPFGLLSFEKEGRHDLLLYTSESDLANLDLKLGGDYFYTMLGTGGGLEHAYAAVGIGVTVPSDKLWLDFDAVQAAYVKLGATRVTSSGVSGPFGRPPTGVARVRATVGLQLAKEFAPFAGASMNVRIPGDYRLVDVAPDFLTADEGEIIGWPGVFAGAQF